MHTSNISTNSLRSRLDSRLGASALSGNSSIKSFGRSLVLIVLGAALLTGCANKRQSAVDSDTINEQVERLYDRAKRAMDNGNYFFALDYYRLLEANFPYGRVTEQAKLDIIYALNKTDQVEEAVEAADNFIELYPTHANVDYAYYMKGVSSFEKKGSRIDRYIRGTDYRVRDPQPLLDSEAAFVELLQRFPDSQYADDASQRIVFLRNRLAERELHVAEYYFKDKSYVAVVNRCKNIVYKYENSPAVKDALILMEAAYTEMGLSDLAQSTREVLALNFPDAKTITTSQKRGWGLRLPKLVPDWLKGLMSRDSDEPEVEVPDFYGSETPNE